MNVRTLAALAARSLALLAIAGAPLAASAQNFELMIQQQMAAMNANIARGQQMVNGVVQQRMQDPAVMQAWQRYLQQTGGRPAMDYPTFTYNYVYTNGFSAQGVAAARANEQRNQAGEMQAWQGLQDAQRQRAQAQAGMQAGFFANQQEAGRLLQGTSTYVAPNGQPMALPHTWQRNTTYEYQGGTYHVDASGRYYVLAANGWWYPLAAR